MHQLSIYPEKEYPVQIPPSVTAPPTFKRTLKAPGWFWFLSLAILAAASVVLFQLISDINAGTFTPVQLLGPLVMWVLIVPFSVGVLRVNVRADFRGLHVNSGIFGFRIRQIRPESMTIVVSEPIVPSEWGAQFGGYGWRFFMGGSAVVFDASEALIVELDNGHRFAIAVPDSQLAAKTLQTVQDLHDDVLAEADSEAR